MPHSIAGLQAGGRARGEDTLQLIQQDQEQVVPVGVPHPAALHQPHQLPWALTSVWVQPSAHITCRAKALLWFRLSHPDRAGPHPGDLQQNFSLPLL